MRNEKGISINFDEPRVLWFQIQKNAISIHHVTLLSNWIAMHARSRPMRWIGCSTRDRPVWGGAGKTSWMAEWDLGRHHALTWRWPHPPRRGDRGGLWYACFGGGAAQPGSRGGPIFLFSSIHLCFLFAKKNWPNEEFSRFFFKSTNELFDFFFEQQTILYGFYN